ncbi:hypothetical protein [Desulfoluna spongiiphila]|uniref:hypothetical protein n=1 Tax=Desulfoluna spongiiphila TaxID=419481 RepID=UPI000B82C866|nr:hypothetical protein [Desulfoluna spongiiphila]
MNDITTIAVVVCAILLVGYFACILVGEKSKPDLMEAISLILTSSGMVSAIKLGYIAIFQTNLFVGPLEDQRIPIIVGAFAIMWVSVNFTWKIFSNHLNYHLSIAEKA